MSFFSSKKEDELVLVFNIGSSYVSGAFLEIQKNNKPKIIFSIREKIDVKENIDFESFLHSTFKSIDLISNKLLKIEFKIPRRIFCVLSSSFYASQIRTITLNRNTSFVFNQKMADTLIQKEISIFEEEFIKNNISKTEDVRLLEFKSMQILLNGYISEKPLNQKIKNLEMSIFVSIANNYILKNIKDSIRRYFNFKDIRFISFSMASFAVIRNLFSYQKDFILLDIGGEITDISLIRKDILCSSASFPFGINFIIRGLSNIMKCSFDEAKTDFMMYKDNHLTEILKEKTRINLEKVEKEWILNFEKCLLSLSKQGHLSSTVFLTIDKKYADYFSEIIKREQMNQYNMIESKFNVIYVNMQTLHNHIIFKDNSLRDEFLAIDSIYINNFLS
ncbi:hypothetical protein K8Q94_00740 [Candidatus Nomurabacteria bacterium]|nr:hypothetical protein [Candidatus Nomurabacteria bacterium]